MKPTVLKKSLCFLFALLLVSGIFLTQGDQIIYAATVKKQTITSSVLQQGKQFTLVNMPHNGANSIIKEFNKEPLTVNTLQNFDYTPDGRYIFTIGECNTGNKEHGLLSRCSLPSKKGTDAKAGCLESVVLEKFGHSDVLAITQDNLKKQIYNIWVSCKPGADGVGRQIARLTYQVNKAGKGKITKTVYINGFEKTNVTKGKAGFYEDKVKAEWVHCAVDAESNQIVFRLKLPAGYSCVYLSYNLKSINKALNSLKNKATFNIGSKPKWQLARIECGLSPLCSFQSFDVEGKSLYLAGGNFGLGAEIYVINYKTYKNGNVKQLTVKKKSQLSEVISINNVIKVDDALYDKNYLETEGFKVEKKNGKITCSLTFNCAGPSLRDTTAVYSFTTK